MGPWCARKAVLRPYLSSQRIRFLAHSHRGMSAHLAPSRVAALVPRTTSDHAGVENVFDTSGSRPR